MNENYSKKVCDILKEGVRCKKLLGPAPGRRGATGPTGPTGPAGPLSSDYGRRYDSTANPIVLTQNIMKTIPLSTVGATSGITYDTADTLTIAEAGIYFISFGFSGSSSVSTDVTVEVVKNDVMITGSSVMKTVTANVANDFIGSIIVSLSANDNITLGIDATNEVTITPSNGSVTYLNVMQISK